MNDLIAQKDYIASNAWRLIAMQDQNRASPSYGCFHLAYWRDKTSEFPDARFQEAGAALGLLAHPLLDGNDASWHKHFSSGLLNLERQQYASGCFDEWYKGEQGFAATHFTIIAYGLTAYFFPDILAQEDNNRLQAVMRKAADWLSGRDDLLKTNHESAAVLALALTAKITGEERYFAAAQDKLQKTLRAQHEEGWFPEIGGADLGYSFLILDMLMLYHLVSGDEAPLKPMKKLFHFLLPHLQPDIKVMPQAGLCQNSYVGRPGLILLAKHDDGAKSAVKRLQEMPASQEGLLPTLADDLRLCRWAYLPLVAFLLQETSEALGGQNLEEFYPQGWSYDKAACLVSYHDQEKHVFMAAVDGGAVDICIGDQKHHDPLPNLLIDKEYYTASGYDPARHVSQNDEVEFSVASTYAKPKFFFPSFLQRFILRIGSTTPIGSRLLRQGIDWIRLKKKSAVNQSVGATSGSIARVTLTRTIGIKENTVYVRDVIDASAEKSVVRVLVANHEEVEVSPENPIVCIEKTYLHEGNSPAIVVNSSNMAA